MKHALSFSSSEEVSTALVRENSHIERISLQGEQNLLFSDEKYCIGYKTDADEYKPCRHGAAHVRQCPSCAARDVARVYTVGDFSLYPHLKDTLDTEKYIIYLAQFGTDITKVGLTRRSRYKKRWREQGADFAVALLEFDGPDNAYPAEQYLQNLFGFRNSVQARQKIKRISFDCKKAKSVLESAMLKVTSSPQVEPYLTGEQIEDLSSYYPQVKNPDLVDYVQGKVLGAKGHWLFFEGASGLHYACNMNGQIGKFLEEKKNGGLF
ncbi:MAG: DUF2797 domain-containing protein [Candidatus Micrarchaeota archaeon]